MFDTSPLKLYALALLIIKATSPRVIVSLKPKVFDVFPLMIPAAFNELIARVPRVGTSLNPDAGALGSFKFNACAKIIAASPRLIVSLTPNEVFVKPFDKLFVTKYVIGNAYRSDTSVKAAVFTSSAATAGTTAVATNAAEAPATAKYLNFFESIFIH